MGENTGEGRSNLAVLSLMAATGLAAPALLLTGPLALACGFLAGMATAAGVALLLPPSGQADAGDSASVPPCIGEADDRPWIDRIEVVPRAVPKRRR